MSTANPYAPPTAEVGDVSGDEVGYQPVKLFSSQGRIGRLRYLAYSLVAYLLVIIVGAVGGFLGAATNSGVLANIFIFGGVVAYLVYWVMLTIQRSHDMDWSGWSVLAAFIPLAILLWIFIGGTQGANRFGAPPPPNTLGVKILGLIFPVIGTIGMVGLIAAIALPAYSDYTKRAKAAQMK